MKIAPIGTVRGSFILGPLVPLNPKINPRNETNLARDTANREPGGATVGALRVQITSITEAEVVSAGARPYNTGPEVAAGAHVVRGTAVEVAAIREIN